jgi:nitronate monooxygenase
MVLDRLEHPIVQAPMGGGPSTPALAAAVAEAGGLGFLAAGYKTVDAVRADILAVRAATGRPFGVNLFAPPSPAADGVGAFAARLEAEAARYGAPVGEPRHDDDGWEAKLALMAELEVPVVSFTFGCPPPDVLAALGETWVTVTTPEEARIAAEAGADALVVQGVEAGGHRATFDDAAPGEIGLLALLQLVRAEVDLPLVATGGIATGRGVAAVLAAGARAAALGTAFMLCDEAATAPAHREAIASRGDTALTRAFTGRSARGIVNRWMREHGADAPSAYPDVHHLTAKIRAAAREQGDADGFHLWAGQAHSLAPRGPAGELVRQLAEEARAALRDAARH